jgi:hypothetical protein
MQTETIIPNAEETVFSESVELEPNKIVLYPLENIKAGKSKIKKQLLAWGKRQKILVTLYFSDLVNNSPIEVRLTGGTEPARAKLEKSFHRICRKFETKFRL